MFLTWHYLVEGEPFPGMPSESLYIRSKSTPSPEQQCPQQHKCFIIWPEPTCILWVWATREGYYLADLPRQEGQALLSLKAAQHRESILDRKVTSEKQSLCLEMLKHAISVGGRTYPAWRAPPFLHPRYSHYKLGIFPASLAQLNAICTN